jgi:hypothetical protein
MKLSVTFDLPLPEGAEEFIRVIAKVHGISSDELSDITDGLETVCEEQTKALFYNLTISALSAYLGFAGAQTIEQIRAHFETAAEISATLTSE